MPSMPGPLELMIIAALALIVFGPARLPEIARSIGKAVNEFRRHAADLKSEFDLQMDEEDDSTPAHVKPSQSPDPSGSTTTEAPGKMDPDPTAPDTADAPEPGPLDKS